MSVRCIEISRQRSFVDLNAILARTVVPTWKSKDTRSRCRTFAWRHLESRSARHTHTVLTYLRQIGVVAYLSVHGHMTGVDSRRRDDERRGEEECQHRPCGDQQITRHRRDNSPIHSRIKRSPRGRSTRIDHRWIIDESQRDTDTRSRDVAEPEVLHGRGHRNRDKRIIICASAINAIRRSMSERETARSFLSLSLSPSLSLSSSPLTAISLSVAALFPLDVSTIRRIARYCALSMPQPLLPPTNPVATSLRRGSRVSPSSALLLLRVRPPRTRDVTFPYAAIASRGLREIL